MTNEELREAAEVMRRAANGEPVQWKARNSLHGAWNDCGSKGPVWGWDTDTYRIRPQPNEVWIWAPHLERAGDRIEVEVHKVGKPPNHIHWRKFREVLGDD